MLNFNSGFTSICMAESKGTDDESIVTHVPPWDGMKNKIFSVNRFRLAFKTLNKTQKSEICYMMFAYYTEQVQTNRHHLTITKIPKCFKEAEKLYRLLNSICRELVYVDIDDLKRIQRDSML